MTCKLRPVVKLVSDIGALGFDLQHHDDANIVEAVRILRTVNPEMFDWLSRILASPDRPCVCLVDDGLVQEWVQKARAVARSKGIKA